MNRRAILRRLGAMAGGVALAPACSRFSGKEVLAAYENLNITEKEDDLVRTLCEIIIPASDGIKGANDLMIEDFVMVMVNDCLDKEKQVRFQNGLKALTPYTRNISGKDPDELTRQEWEHTLLSLLKADDKTAIEDGLEWSIIKDAKFFINSVKEFTIQGFITSKYYMTEVMPYSMLPGPFKGKVLIKEGEKINLYG